MTPADRRGGRALHVALGIAVSGVLIWLAFRKRDFGALWSDIRSVRVIPLLVTVAVATIPFPLRVPRWELLLRRDDGGTLPRRSLWQSIAIGFAANNLLPFRAGEILRVGAANRLTGVPFAAALSSVAVERVIDALTVVALLGLGLLTADLPPGVRIGGVAMATVATRVGLVCLAVLVMAIVAAWRRPSALRLLERLLPRGKTADRLVHFADHVLRGTGALRDPRRAAPIVVWSAVIWLVNASAYYAMTRAFSFPVPFSGALILQGALMIGIAVPSTPGYVGVFEAIIPAVLALYGIDQNAALACALVYHVTTFIPITFLGVLAAIRTGVHLRTGPELP